MTGSVTSVKDIVSDRDAVVSSERNAAFAAMAGDISLVDLSEALGPNTVMWPGMPAPSSIDIATFEKEGFYARQVTVFEHSGTHLDAPGHFLAGGQDTSEIPLENLVVAVRVIDIASSVGDDAHAILVPSQVEAHEAKHGRIPAGVAVLLNTGWARKNANPREYAGPDGELTFPGFGAAAADMLVSRGVVGLGIDTLSIDAGAAHDQPVHSTVSLPHGLWHLENLINLHQVPPAGAVLAVAVPRLVGGTGFPARVFAMVPRNWRDQL